MTLRVEVDRNIIRWARRRSGISRDDLIRRFPLEEWEAGDRVPTLRQLEGYAKATHTPIGYFFLPEPPAEPLPIPDFRTMRDEAIRGPSADLLDTIYECQQRQEWFRRFALRNDLDPVDFVASRTLNDSTGDVAAEMRERLDYGIEERGANWSIAFRTLSDNAEALGVLVMVNSVVGSNTHRKLHPDEFRGFALVDDLAPTVFINGGDTKAAQLFTFAHELAHLWLGRSGVDDLDLGTRQDNNVERWCNAVASELLVPLGALQEEYRDDGFTTEELNRLARVFKTSTLVVLKRLHEAQYLSWTEYRQNYEEELARVLEFAQERGGAGGNFYNTQPLRVSKTFARAIISETLSGRTSYSDAFQMLGVKKSSTLNRLGEHLGVA